MIDYVLRLRTKEVKEKGYILIVSNDVMGQGVNQRQVRGGETGSEDSVWVRKHKFALL